MNLNGLARGFSQGLLGYRQGQLQREELDREQQQQELRNMLAIAGERRQQQQTEALGQFRLDQLEQQRLDREAARKQAWDMAWQSAQERRDAAERERQLKLELQRQQQEFAAQQNQMNRDTQRAMQFGRTDATAQTRDNRNVDKMASDYRANPIVKEAYGLSGAVADIQVGLAQNNGFGDLQAVYGMVKMFDPNSVVREGEIKLTRAANSLPGSVRLMIDNVNSGRLLTPEMRQQMQDLLSEQMATRERLVAPIQARFGAQARDRGIEGDSAYIAPSPFDGVRREKPKGRPSDFLQPFRPKGGF